MMHDFYTLKELAERINKATGVPGCGMASCADCKEAHRAFCEMVDQAEAAQDAARTSRRMALSMAFFGSVSVGALVGVFSIHFAELGSFDFFSMGAAALCALASFFGCAIEARKLAELSQ